MSPIILYVCKRIPKRDYAQSKLEEANNKLAQVLDSTNGLSQEQRQQLTAGANALNRAWGETDYPR